MIGAGPRGARPAEASLGVRTSAHAIASPPPGGRAELRLRRVGEELELSMADNGPGIRTGYREVVFGRFRQIGDTMGDEPQGAGPGLAYRAASSASMAAVSGWRKTKAAGRSSGSGCAARQRKLTLGPRRAPRNRGGVLPQDGQSSPKR